MTLELVIRSILLGVGLAMDAFSVSLADGLNERKMGTGRILTIAGTFAAFQFVMPMTGWFLVRTAADMFESFRKFIPWIAFALLLYIGGKMLIEGIRENRGEAGDEQNTASAHPASELIGAMTTAEIGISEIRDDGIEHMHESESPNGAGRLGAGDLFLQGVATSIDALSVGFTIASYTVITAVTSSLIIGVVTLFICTAGLRLGRSIGTRLSGRASIFGGAILIAIGVEILIKGII